jgi:hypothetical protein
VLAVISVGMLVVGCALVIGAGCYAVYRLIEATR